VHRKARMVAEAMRGIENEQGRDARDVEVAEAMGISIEEYHHRAAGRLRLADLQPGRAAGGGGGRARHRGPARNRHTEGPYDGLRRATLPGLGSPKPSRPSRAERLVIALYYDEELNLREIGPGAGGQPSRASARSTASVPLRLRARLKDWLPEAGDD